MQRNITLGCVRLRGPYTGTSSQSSECSDKSLAYAVSNELTAKAGWRCTLDRSLQSLAEMPDGMAAISSKRMGPFNEDLQNGYIII